MRISESPALDNMPEYISQSAIPVWEYVIRRFSDEIFTNRRLVDVQWENAISAFERACKSRNIEPYSKYLMISSKLKELVKLS